MADLSKRKAIAIINALKRDSKVPVGSTDGIQMSIEFTDVKNAKNSTSAVSPIPMTIGGQEMQLEKGLEDLPSVAIGLPDFIEMLRHQEDELYHDAANKMEALAKGNARHHLLRDKYIHGIVKYAQLKWLVQIAVGECKYTKTDRPLELLAQWLKLDAGARGNLDGFLEQIVRQKEDGNESRGINSRTVS